MTNQELHEFICEVCDTREELTDADAYNNGWDYPPFMGAWGIISSRTCPNCVINKTAWWALVVAKTPVEELSERHLATIQRILLEVPRD